MNEITFDNQVQEKIDLLNHVLSDLGAATVFDNRDFSIGVLSSEYYVELILDDIGKHCIPMTIGISPQSIEIGLDRKPEIYQWATKDIENSKTYVINSLRELFTSHWLVERCGSNYTSFSAFDSNGERLFKTPVINGFYLRFKCQNRLFFPIYPQR